MVKLEKGTHKIDGGKRCGKRNEGHYNKVLLYVILIGVGNQSTRRIPQTCHKLLTLMLYRVHWWELKLQHATLMIATDFKDRDKSKYCTIMATRTSNKEQVMSYPCSYQRVK